MANSCKFQKTQYQVSYDSGTTWEDVVPTQFAKGELLEYDSLDCTSMETLYRWRTLEGQYLCDGNKMYVKEIQEESYNNGITWYVSYPTIYRGGEYVGEDAEFCCDKFVGHYIYLPTPTCPSGYYWNGVRCVRNSSGGVPSGMGPKYYYDPLKVIKCDGNGSLTSADTKYYTDGYILFNAEIGDSVSSIGTSAFSNTMLETIVIPSGVTIIGNSAFRVCRNLTSIELSNSLTSIGNAAFRYCSGLTSIEIPSSVTSIGSYAFANCSSLTAITVNAITPPTLGTDVFLNTNSNLKIYVPCESYKVYISNNDWSSYISRIDPIPPCEIQFYKFITTYSDGSRYIGKCDGNTELSQRQVRISGFVSVDVGDCVEGISISGFEGCSGLTSIHISSSCTKFHGYCFSGCTNLSSVTIDTSVIDANTGDGNWYYGQFSACRNLKEVSFTNLTQGCIPPNCFSGCWALSSVTLGNPTCISEMAFSSCQSLTSIDLGSNITSIGNRAFANCTSLTDVYIRQTANILSGVYNNSFPSSTRIHVPCVVWFDWYKAYNIDHNLGNDIIPIENDCLPYESLIYEWRAANINTAYECVGYDKHYKEYKYVSIDSGETWYKTYETRVGALYQVNSVDCGYTGETKFRATYDDERIYIIPCTSSTLTYDETHPNGYTGNMITAVVGDCVTSIGNTAFRESTSLSSVTIGSGTTSIGKYAFRECRSITSIELPNNLNTIGVGAFRYCTSLTSVTIPDSVTIIGLSDGFGDSTFGNCTSLINVTIGSGVTSIDNAFQGCTSLTSVTIKAITPPTLDSSAFNNTNNCPIYVPAASLNTYKSASGWNTYTDRIQAIPT